MINIQELSKVGFGGYRISFKSQENIDALQTALLAGCNLIDTASNYSDGDSELLIGSMLKETPQKKVFVITKAGYISGNNLKRLRKSINIEKSSEFVEISDHLIHSIAPDYLEDQIEISLNRLNRHYIDAFLLHSPEYFFKINPLQNEVYYDRIKIAFEFLEEKVRQGKIRYYGISSNVFTTDPQQENATDLNKIVEIAAKISSNSNFKFVQFPYNLVECGTATPPKDSKNSLIAIAKRANLSILGNRPLNANTENGLLRLVYHHLDEMDYVKDNIVFNDCLKYIEDVLKKNYEGTTLDDIEVMVFLMKKWNKIESAEIFQAIFYNMLYPFLTTIYQGNIPKKVLAHFKHFEQIAWNYHLLFLSTKTANYLHQNHLSHLLHDLKEPFSAVLVNKYLEEGIDHVLSGMTKTKYVNELKKFF